MTRRAPLSSTAPRHGAPRHRKAVQRRGALRAALIGIAMIMALALRVAFIRRAPIAVDELEHVHGAFLVSLGETPYVDFFQHHTPLYYLLGGALIPRRPTYATLLAARWLSLAAHLLTIGLASWWMVRLRGRSAGLIAFTLLASNAVLFRFGTLGYLDTYAALMLVGGGFLLTEAAQRGGGRRVCFLFASGAAFMAAVATTQKLFLTALVPGVWFAARLWSKRRSPSEVVAFCAGGLAVIAALSVAMGGEGIVGMWQDTVALNLRWKARHRPVGEAIWLLKTGGPVYLLAILGVVEWARSWRRGRHRPAHGGPALTHRPNDVPVLFLVSLLLGMVLLPVVWDEYFISAAVFASLVAALTIHDHWPNLAGGPAGSRTTLHAASRPTSRPTSRSTSRSGKAGAAFAVAALVGFPMAIQAAGVRFSNGEQRAAFEFVQAVTPPGEPVYDSYVGYGAFRPHAYRYWLLHDELQQMLSEAEKTTGIVSALERLRPRVALVDEFTDHLPAATRQYLADHYVATRFEGVLCRADLLAECRAKGG